MRFGIYTGGTDHFVSQQTKKALEMLLCFVALLVESLSYAFLDTIGRSVDAILDNRSLFVEAILNLDGQGFCVAIGTRRAEGIATATCDQRRGLPRTFRLESSDVRKVIQRVLAAIREGDELSSDPATFTDSGFA